MSTIKQILRLWIQGKNIKAIARSTLVSKNTVKKYLQLVQSMGLSVEELLGKEDPELESLLSGRGATDDRELAMLRSMLPEFSRAIGDGINRWTLWGEYRIKQPSGYSYSRFCYHLQQYLDQQRATMHIEHQPGEHMYIDFTGKRLSVVDPETGEIREVEVFVSLLGYSQLTYVEAVYTQTLGDFIRATENALRYFGGSPRVVVCDNLKAAVKRASRFEPAINDSFNDFANHYQMVVLPARPHKPKDKALVENAVRIIYNRIFAALRGRVFYSLSELNEAIRRCLEEHNRLLFQGRQESRWSRHESIEKHTLTPLPVNGFELKKYLEVTVQKNCHIEVREDRHYYSVPHRYIGKKVRVVYTQSTVTIYFQGKSVAFHLRSFRRFGYTTVREHLSSSHQFYLDWSPEKFLKWAADIDPQVADLIDKLIRSKPYPEQAYKSCLGILSMAKQNNRDRLIEACSTALQLEIFNYNFIRNRMRLKHINQLDPEPEKLLQYKLPLHENIRGASCYE